MTDVWGIKRILLFLFDYIKAFFVENTYGKDHGNCGGELHQLFKKYKDTSAFVDLEWIKIDQAGYGEKGDCND